MHALTAVLVLAAGCTTLEPPELSPDVEPPPLVPDVVVAPGGPHRIATLFDLDPGDLVAEPAALTRTLLDYANAPGATMLAAAAEADSAALATLRANLSDAQEQQLAGWIDEAFNPLGRLLIVSVEWSVGEALETFELESELVFTGGNVTHTVLAIDFTRSGLEQRFELTAGEDDIYEATALITTAGYGLTIGEHELAVPVGGFAWDAVSQKFASAGGIRGSLAAATQCAFIALSVATQIGHAFEVNELCERALDQLAVRSRAEAAAFRFESLLLKGTVGMNDSDRDGVGEGLFGGEWKAEIDAGAGAVAVTARFE